MDYVNIEVTGIGEIAVLKYSKLFSVAKKLKLKNVVAAFINNEVISLDYVITDKITIKFIDSSVRIGNRIYLSSLKFLFVVSVKELFGNKVKVVLKHAIDKGILCEFKNLVLSEEVILKIKEKMNELVKKELSIKKVRVSRKDTIGYYKSINEIEKVNRYKIYNSSTVTMYKLLNYYEYFYSEMVINTGMIDKYNLTFLSDNYLILSGVTIDGDVPEYNHKDKVLNVFNEYEDWCKKLGVFSTSMLNKVITNDNIKNFIMLNEINQNKVIDNVVNKIVDNVKTKIILITGPSSSGKTTTSKKIALYLKNSGINTFVISLDDYFKDREDTPRDEYGNYDFESLEAIDVKLFNSDVNKLLNFEGVKMPSYNFILGKKEFSDKEMFLEESDVLIVEGLHALNKKIINDIPDDFKFKIYVSPFTPLSVDNYNYVSTIDSRLIRRVVRDNMFRGYNASKTLESWKNVRYGEEKYVFKYQNDADVIINTALIYELGVLKTYALPLLYSVENKDRNYDEAKRLVDFLNNFFNIPSEYVPIDSVLREFIGNGYFK